MHPWRPLSAWYHRVVSLALVLLALSPRPRAQEVEGSPAVLEFKRLADGPGELTIGFPTNQGAGLLFASSELNHLFDQEAFRAMLPASNNPTILAWSTPESFSGFAAVQFAPDVEPGELDLAPDDGETDLTENDEIARLVGIVPAPIPVGAAFPVRLWLQTESGRRADQEGAIQLELVDSLGQGVAGTEIDPTRISLTNGYAVAQVRAVGLTEGQAAFLRATWLPSVLSARVQLNNSETAVVTVFQTTPLADAEWVYPLDASPAAIPCTGPFGEWPGHMGLQVNGRVHEGHDLAAGVGTPVLAAAAGQFYKVDNHKARVDHGLSGAVTVYKHIEPSPNLANGAAVNAGQIIGHVAHLPGVKIHLHFEVRRGGVAVNPVDYVPTLKAYVVKQPELLNYWLQAANPAQNPILNSKQLLDDGLGSHPNLVLRIQHQTAGRIVPRRITMEPNAGVPQVIDLGDQPTVTHFKLNPQQPGYAALPAGTYLTPQADLPSGTIVAILGGPTPANQIVNPANVYRFWFPWDTSPFRGLFTGTARIRITLEAFNGRQVAEELEFGPWFPEKQSYQALNVRHFTVKMKAALGRKQHPLPPAGKDHDQILIGLDSTAFGSGWKAALVGADLTETRTFSIRSHNQEHEFGVEITPTDSAGCTPPGTLRLRAVSTKLPDLGDELMVTFALPGYSTTARSRGIGPQGSSVRTDVEWRNGRMTGDTATADVYLRDDSGMPLAGQSLRFSVSLNGRGGPLIPTQVTDCEGKAVVITSRVLDRGGLAGNVRITAYFEGADGYQPSHQRIEIRE